MSAAAPVLDLSEYEGFVRSPLAERVARVVRLGGHFPRIVGDPELVASDLEQFLVEEAVLVGDAVRESKAEAHTAAWDEAFQKSREAREQGR